MQHISNRFNRFYHKRILKDLFEQSYELVFNDVLDTRTGKAFIFRKYRDFEDEDELKQKLKILNWDYPVDEKEDIKVSTSDIETKTLVRHIDWVLRLSAFNGIELPLVKEEWDRLTNKYK